MAQSGKGFLPDDLKALGEWVIALSVALSEVIKPEPEPTPPTAPKGKGKKGKASKAVSKTKAESKKTAAKPAELTWTGDTLISKAAAGNGHEYSSLLAAVASVAAVTTSSSCLSERQNRK